MQILYKQNEWMETKKKEGREAGFLTEYDNEAKTGMERLLNIKILSKAIEQNKNKREDAMKNCAFVIPLFAYKINICMTAK